MKYSTYAPPIKSEHKPHETSDTDSSLNTFGEHNEKKVDKVSSNILILTMNIFKFIN